MTESKKSKIFRVLGSLRFRLLIVTIVLLVIGVAVWLSVKIPIVAYLDNVYTSEEEKIKRHDDYIVNLQTYVSNNKLSSEDTAQIVRWMEQKRNVYLFLYKDGKLFFEGYEEPDDTEKEDDGEDIDSVFDDGSLKDPSHNHMTREEILALAEENGLAPVEFSDGTLLVSIYDYSEDFYYSAANIFSVFCGVLVFIVFLMIYFSGITSKMLKLAKDVRVVYESDMNYKIRTDNGSDELAHLRRDIEQMRVTMLDSLEEAEAARDANTELITSMSHDIRTPLTVLLGYIDILKETDDSGMREEYLKATEQTALRLKDLSDDMFKYFLIHGEYTTPELAEYDAATLIGQFTAEHMLLLVEKGYSVESEIEIEENEIVVTDAPKMMRVFDNLFSNIYKYADILKPVSIYAKSEKDAVSVVIENYIADGTRDAESNHIGLRTAKKLCDIAGAEFSFFEKEVSSEKVFCARVNIKGKKIYEDKILQRR